MAERGTRAGAAASGDEWRGRGAGGNRGVLHEVAAKAARRRRDAALRVGKEDVTLVRAVEGEGAGEEVGRQPDVVLHDGHEGAVGQKESCK